MAAASSSSSSRTLEQTPTWAFASVFFAFISISLIMEHCIQHLGHWLTRHRKKALNEALEKLKSELMLLGFISLLLGVAQGTLSRICIPTSISDTMLPCKKTNSTTTALPHDVTGRRLLLSYLGGGGDMSSSHRRELAGTMAYDHCEARGMVSLVSQDGIHHLHIFIFVLAVIHVIYSLVTMGLGRLKMRRWKAWEKETQSTWYQASNDPERFRYFRQTTFARRHIISWTETTIHLWIKCFFRQFYSSVAKVDYLTLRHGFISAHLPNTNGVFNFQKYIKRSLDDDFKVVLVLYVGTNLEVVVVRMALQLQEESVFIKGTPLVQPNDNLFPFGRPQLVLHLIHFTLFQNAFEMAFFIWTCYEYGVRSCYHERLAIIIIRVVITVIVQFMCSYITLPLYALVTQMGSQYKKSIFEAQTANALIRWHKGVRQKKQQPSSPQNPSVTPPIVGSSPDKLSLVLESKALNNFEKPSPISVTMPLGPMQDEHNSNNTPSSSEITDLHPEVPIQTLGVDKLKR
ncbi:MLO-like protein 2 isoform X2 [Amborella trichopoda]|uniref:MLO-like protein 2 isoform X2 n=1 Tax=Amborella trichopoda TaxID=13333 RepID=UPI0009BF70FC|nr:MLO-like protein 2 isoform X2 [Amborella trichopoda]|eukprot:XP_020518732.1 MLO-like protein 2 isoform X2 [Amborella trichopoda]